MRILFVLSGYHPKWGGAENQAHKQASEFVRRGHMATVVTWQSEPEWPEEDMVDGVRIYRVPRANGGIVAKLRSLALMTHALARHSRQVDVIACHQMLLLAYLAGFVGLLLRRPVIVKPAITATPADPELSTLDGPALSARFRRLLCVPLRYRAIVAAMTDEIERDVLRIGFRRIVRIPNGVRDTGLGNREETRSELFGPLGIHTDCKVVVAAGRLVWYKGFDTLLTAWPMIERASGRTALLIFGSGPEEGRLRQQIAALDLDGFVRLMGANPRSSEYLAAADVVAIPSEAEGMSNVLLEAMAAGVPVVATRVSGAIDLITDGHNGYLVTPRDPAALAQALSQALCFPGSVGRRGRVTVLDRCGLERVVSLYERAFANAHDLPRGVTTAETLAQYPLGRTSSARITAQGGASHLRGIDR